MPKLQLLPAVDVADGQAVRLVQGEAGSETSYGDPLDAALQPGSATAPSGSTWSTSTPPSAAAATASCWPASSASSTSTSSSPAASGTTSRWPRRWPPAAAGSTWAPPRWSRPEWCARAIAEHGDRIAVGLDVRGTRLAARGWTQEGGELYETLARLDAEGCARYVVTDITKDGTLRGPNLDLLREVCAATDRPVIASGGVSSLDDIRALAGLTAVGVEGAIVGKALYAGAFTLPEALRVTEEVRRERHPARLRRALGGHRRLQPRRRPRATPRGSAARPRSSTARSPTPATPPRRPARP